MSDERDTGSFSKMGRSYQERVVQALFQDPRYADQMSDVLEPKYFSLDYLEVMSRMLFDYQKEYKEFPSLGLIEIMVSNDESLSKNDVLVTQVRDFVKRAAENPLNGDMQWIQDNSLEFCKRAACVHALTKALEKIEDKDYESITKIMKDALNRGASRDAGHDYSDGLGSRSKKNRRDPISTGWKPVDKVLNGGWERGTLSTFIAPTGAGKSMFLVNVAAAAIAQGLNVLYVTMEMADWKIGLRADSYFSGIPINEISDNVEKVQAAIGSNVKGRLIIKEWPTKSASVQMIRAHIQKLEQLREFKPDIVIVDYADLLKSSGGYGDKRHELEGIYEELRGLGQELKMVMITADQTNRGALNEELVTLGAIAESYAKATVCDLIFTVSRTMEDKQNGTGRLFVAKSRLGDDGMVFSFQLRPATVKVTVLDHSENPVSKTLNDPEEFRKAMANRAVNMQLVDNKQ